MKTNHTPGPWTVFEPASLDVCYEGGEYPATIRGAGIHVATMPGERLLFSGTVKSNARLIASAPELLEALEFLVHDYRVLFAAYQEKTGEKAFGWGLLSAERAVEAIAKARGENGGAL